MVRGYGIVNGWGLPNDVPKGRAGLNANIDTAWNSYINELNTINVQRMIAIVQRVYDRMYK